MQPLRILLVCSFGMSTSLLVRSMKQAAANRGLAVLVESAGTDEIPRARGRFDVLLLGPQVRYAEVKARETGLPVGVIEGLVYALAQGDKALDQAESMARGNAR